MILRHFSLFYYLTQTSVVINMNALGFLLITFISLVFQESYCAIDKGIMESHVNSLTPPELKPLFVLSIDAGSSRRRRQAIKDETVVKFSKMAKLIRDGKMLDCAGRVVCDLNCDHSRYGKNGQRASDMISSIQSAGLLSVDDLQYFTTAGLAGRMYWWTSDCKRCATGYPNCFASTDDLVEVASLFDVQQ